MNAVRGAEQVDTRHHGTEQEQVAAVQPQVASAMPPSALSESAVVGAARRLMARLMPFMPVLRLLAFVAAIVIVGVMAYRARNTVNLDQLELWPMAAAVPAHDAVVGAAGPRLVAARDRASRGAATSHTGAGRRRSATCPAASGRRSRAPRCCPGTVPDKLATVGDENVIALCAAAAVGGIGMAASGDVIWLPLALAPLVPPIATRVIGERSRVTAARALHVTWNDAVAFLSYAVAAVLVQYAVSGRTDVAAVAGAAALAWAAGLVVVIAPSGLGVRELTYVALLAGTFPEGRGDDRGRRPARRHGAGRADLSDAAGAPGPGTAPRSSRTT